MEIFINRLWDFRNSSQDYTIKENNKYIEIKLMPLKDSDNDVILEPDESICIKTNVIINDIGLIFNKIESSYYLHNQNVDCTEFWSKTYLNSTSEQDAYHSDGYCQPYICGLVLYVTLINKGSEPVTIHNNMYLATLFFEQEEPDNIHITYYGPKYKNHIPDTTQYKINNRNDKDAAAKIITGNPLACIPSYPNSPLHSMILEESQEPLRIKQYNEELQERFKREDNINRIMYILIAINIINYIYKAVIFFTSK